MRESKKMPDCDPREICPLCGLPTKGGLPKGTTPDCDVKVYHMACLEKEHGLKPYHKRT